MAKVTKRSFDFNTIQWGKGFHEIVSYEAAILDGDVQCFHCGKNIKQGKMAFCASGYITSPFEFGEDNWGVSRGSSSKRTFCSSNHVKLFAKNSNGRI